MIEFALKIFASFLKKITFIPEILFMVSAIRRLCIFARVCVCVCIHVKHL